MAKGKSLEEALQITNRDVAEALDGLPTNKHHCSNLGADALHAAIRDYYERDGKQPSSEARSGGKGTTGRKKEKGSCTCPYCNVETPTDSPICQGCGTALDQGQAT